MYRFRRFLMTANKVYYQKPMQPKAVRQAQAADPYPWIASLTTIKPIASSMWTHSIMGHRIQSWKIKDTCGRPHWSRAAAIRTNEIEQNWIKIRQPKIETKTNDALSDRNVPVIKSELSHGCVHDNRPQFNDKLVYLQAMTTIEMWAITIEPLSTAIQHNDECQMLKWKLNKTQTTCILISFDKLCLMLRAIYFNPLHLSIKNVFQTWNLFFFCLMKIRIRED